MEAINAKGDSHICMHLPLIGRRMRRGRSVAAAEERERAPRAMQGDTNQWDGGGGGDGGVGAVHGGGESVARVGAVELQAEQMGGAVEREPERGAYGAAGEEGVRRRWRWMAEP